LLGNWHATILGTSNYLPIWRKNLKQHKYHWYKHDGSQVELFGVLANGCAIMLYGWNAQLLQKNLMPPKVATFCAINKSFDLPISYHGGPRVELFGVLANGCAIMLYGWDAQLLQRNLMPPKVATFCAINKSFDWHISYHGGPRVELFGVLANGCAIMLYGWDARLLQRTFTPPKVATFCAINK
jgi:hypothetical protein